MFGFCSFFRVSHRPEYVCFKRIAAGIVVFFSYILFMYLRIFCVLI
jgi:hypothetical protein